MKELNKKTGDAEQLDQNENNDRIKNESKVSLTKRIVLLGIPFVLFVVGVALMSVFVFKNYFEKSQYFSLMVNSSISKYVNNGDTDRDSAELNVTREQITPSVYTLTVPVTEPQTTATEGSETEPTGTAEPTTAPTKAQSYEVIQYHSYDEFPPIPWGDCWGTMTISSIGLRGAPMYNGDDTQILSYTHKKAIGKRYGSQFPGQGGVTVLCSHVTRAFYGLQDVKIGDKVTLNTFYGKYVYQVTETRIIDATDNGILHEKFDEETLVCYTCYPRGRSVRTKRFVIICKKISGMDWLKMGEN